MARLKVGARTRRRVLLIALAAFVGVTFGIVTYATDFFETQELNTVDTRFAIRGERERPDNLVVVAVDDYTEEAFPQQREWPYSHDIQAKVVDRLKRDGAKAIVFDIEFSKPSDRDFESIAFLDSIDRANNVVAATTRLDDRGNGNAFTYYNIPKRVFESEKHQAITRWIERDLDVRIGYSSFPVDTGGVIRRFLYSTGGLKSLAIVTAERALRREIGPDEPGGDEAWIDYLGPPGTIDQVHYSNVFEGRFKPGTFHDKIAIVGATDPILQDVHATATSGDGLMAGPEIHAHAIDTVLRGFPLNSSPVPLDVALIVALGLLTPLAGLVTSAGRALAVAIAGGALYTVATQLAFNGGTILPFVYPIGALAVSAVSSLGVHYVTEANERERTRDLFSRFVPASVVGQLLEESGGARLGGVGRTATVMFSDLRGFTSFAESRPPDQVIRILNRYLTAMVDDAIDPNGGTLVDYMGDGIMAVFGAPVEMDDHADRALAAARAKLQELDKFNQWLTAELGFDKSFRMGIGLNTGRVMSGNVGSERRLAYTAIGDTTNTSARLEAMTKGTPYMILMADSTRAALSSEPHDLVFVDEFDVRGREEKVKIWSVAESAREAEAGATFQSVSKT
jgi:adenylate cyclase